MSDAAPTTPAPERGLRLRSLVTDSGTVEVSLEEAAVSTPGPEQVVVRVEAAPVNPSDLGVLLAGADPARVTLAGEPEHPVLRGQLSDDAVRAAAKRIGQSLPVGNEGAGTVVAAGSSPAAQELLGRTVSAAGGAMYAQYCLVDVAACLALPDGAAEAGAAAFVNPLTALGMVETMRAEDHTGLVHTAAASNLGQMLHRLCREEGVPLVNVVRRPEQRELLRGLGAEWVCDTSASTFDDDLATALRATGATLAFDAVGGGRLADRILAGMERVAASDRYERYGSSVHKQVYLYGVLQRGPTELTRTYGMAWGVGGWLLTPFLQAAGPDAVTRLRARVVDGLTTTFASDFDRRVGLAGALDPEAVAVYGARSTGKKYLITPQAG